MVMLDKYGCGHELVLLNANEVEMSDENQIDL